MWYKVLIFVTTILGYISLGCPGPVSLTQNVPGLNIKKAVAVPVQQPLPELALNQQPMPSIEADSFTIEEGSQPQQKPAINAAPKTSSALAMYRGIYLNNVHGLRENLLAEHIADMKKYGLNAAVIDIQPRMPEQHVVNSLKKAGIFPIARLVCFDQGLKTSYPSEKRMARLKKKARQAMQLGFSELQLDYIRYADGWGRKTLSIKNRYKNLQKIIGEFRMITNEYGALLSADIFGRIPFNKNDIIGQKLEIFAAQTDVLYPMLYPSHFGGDAFRMYNPYETIYEGLDRSKKRLTSELASTRVVAYIQAFKWRTAKSGLSLKKYIYEQVVASERAGNGWVAWNARSRYTQLWKAMELHQKHADTLIPQKDVVYKSYKPGRKDI